jgi:hypothetical protein
MTTQKKFKKWSWPASVLMTMLVVDLCALTWYFWNLPTADSQRLEKTITTVAGWIVSIMGFWGIKHAAKRKMSLAQLMTIPPVQLSTLGITAAVWFFVLPFHAVKILVRGPDGSALAGAMAKVDGVVQGGASDSQGRLVIRSLAARMHTIEVKKGGYSPREFSAGVVEVLTTRELRPAPLEIAEAMVTIKSDPPGAALYIDEESDSRGPAGNPIPLRVGTHTIRLKLSGYEFQQSRIDVRADMSPVLLTLQKVAIPPPKTYPLSVASIPSDAEIWVDGKFEGTTPGKVWVRAGLREIALKKDGYATYRDRVPIPARTMFSPSDPLKELAVR